METAKSNIRFEDERMEQLEKENFDLKLRLFYLEDAHHKNNTIQTSPSLVPIPINVSSKDDYLFQLEEKNIEIEQKNLLIFKAKRAIETLKLQIESLEKEKVDGLNNIIEAKKVGDEKAFEIEQLYKKRLDSLESSILSVEKSKEEWGDELTQSKALVELYLIQIDEQAAEIDELKTSVFEAKHDVVETKERYEEKLKQMRSFFEQNVVKDQLDAEKKLNDTVTKWQEAVDTLTRQYERDVRMINEKHEGELTRLKEDYAIRMSEKSNDITSLKSTCDDVRMQKESLQTELLVAKDMQNKQDIEISSLVTSTTAQNDAIRTLKRSLELSKNEKRAQFEYENDFRDELMQLKAEKTQVVARYEQLSDAYEVLQREIKEYQSTLRLADNETMRLNVECKNLAIKANTVEETCRENERLKSTIHALTTELQAVKHGMEMSIRDVAKYEFDLRELQSSLKLKDDGLKVSVSEVESLRESVQYKDREIEEQRGVIKTLQSQVTSLQHEVSSRRLHLSIHCIYIHKILHIKGIL
jgi:chromosome segregation ATPase